MLLLTALFSLALVQNPPETRVEDVEITAQAEQDAEAAEAARRAEVVCRREHVVGSNRPQRICQTRAQWEGLRDRSLDRIDDGNRRTTESGSSMSGVPGAASGG